MIAVVFVLGALTAKADPVRERAAPVDIVDVFLGAGVLSRSLTYNDDLRGVLQGYALPGAPLLFGTLEYYPGGHVRRGLASAFGLVANGRGAVGLETRGVARTESFAFEGGLRARLVLGRVDLGLAGLVGLYRFRFGAPSAEDAEAFAASVDYLGVMPQASVRVAMPYGLGAAATFGYAFLLGAGELQARYFPRTTGGAFDASVSLSYALTPWLDLRATGLLRWYALAFHPRPGDAFVAGGADDRYISAVLGIAVRR